jgi:hypothetical protein
MDFKIGQRMLEYCTLENNPDVNMLSIPIEITISIAGWEVPST